MCQDSTHSDNALTMCFCSFYENTLLVLFLGEPRTSRAARMSAGELTRRGCGSQYSIVADCLNSCSGSILRFQISLRFNRKLTLFRDSLLQKHGCTSKPEGARNFPLPFSIRASALLSRSDDEKGSAPKPPICAAFKDEGFDAI